MISVLSLKLDKVKITQNSIKRSNSSRNVQYVHAYGASLFHCAENVTRNT